MSEFGRIRKIAPAADTAKITRKAITVALGRAKRLKLAKMMVSQNTSTARKGAGIGLSVVAPGLREIGADLYRPGLKGALGVILWRKLLYLGEACFGHRSRPEGHHRGGAGTVFCARSDRPGVLGYAAGDREPYRSPVRTAPGSDPAG